MDFDPATKRRFVVVLGFMAATGAAAVDMSLASFPAMASALGTAISAGQQVVGVFVLGMGLGQIPAGIMGDRVGRMPVIYVGLTIFTLAGVATAFATSIDFMLAARFVQGLGASVGIVMSRAMVRDMATREEAARMLSVISMVFTIAPMLAPIIGGYLVEHVGWRAPFAAVAVFGLAVLLMVATMLRETGTPTAERDIARQLWFSATEFVAHRRSILGAILVIVTAMGFMTVISGASALIIDIYGYSAQEFGFIFATAGMSIFVASMINRQLLLRFNMLQMTGLGALLVGLGGAQLLLIAALGDAPFWWLWASVCLYLGGFSFLFANATAMALEPIPHVAGAASSLMGASQNALSSASAIVGGLIYNGSVTNSVLLMGSFGTLVLLIFLGRNAILREPQRLFPG
jgi:DHA1 family bicyclomycin/chloramphenicol resistance-like MFS transporter